MNTKRIIGFIGLALLAAVAAAVNRHFQFVHLDLSAIWGAGAVLAAVPAVFTEDQATEFRGLLGEIKTGWTELKGLPNQVREVQEHQEELKEELRDVRRGVAIRGNRLSATRTPGVVSEDCARNVAAHFIAHCERSGKLEALTSLPAQREALAAFACDSLGLQTRSALTTTEVPLPVEYGNEIRELISAFGVARRQMMTYPIGMGTARPARMGARPSFGSIAMSAAFAEKSPALGFASLESHKIGGVVRLPREIDEQSIVAMGQFLARYGAVEFARAEDTWAFLADGSGTYETVKGIVQTARDNGYTVPLATTKTKPSDATLADFRSLRRKVNKAALNGRLSAYYLDSTWETQLPSFRTTAEPFVYQRLPDGSATLDGYPIVWTDVMAPFGTTATVDSPLAVFGALSFWWMGEHGSPRIDTSEHVWFANDQLAVRFIEEIDFDYAALDATAVLLTAAS
jgi:HK97 family phage major capsid protein